MIKSKRKLNKQAIINLRRWVIKGHSDFHYFQPGDVVQFVENTSTSIYVKRLRDDMYQYVKRDEMA